MAQAFRSGIGTRHKAKHGVDGNDRGTAVADQGQGQTDNGHNTDAHAHVDHNLEDQSGCGAEADHPAHIVLAPDAHVEAPGDDGQFQQHDQHAAEEAQLLTHGGEDVVRMLGEEGSALGTVAVEQPLTRQTAAGEGEQVDLGVVPLVDAQGVDGGVEQDPNTVFLVIAQELPQNRRAQSDAGESQTEPEQADTAGKGHADEDEHENQGNARILGKHHVQTDQHTQVEYHVHHRVEVGDPVLVGIHDRGHDDDVSNFADFRGLDHNGHQGDIQPASVTGIVIGAEGNQHQQQKGVESHQPVPPLGHGFDVNGRNQREHHNAQQRGGQLNDDILDAVVTEFIGIGGTGDGNTAESRSDQAEQKQDPVALFGEIPEFLKKTAHSIASFLAIYYSTLWQKSK